MESYTYPSVSMGRNLLTPSERARGKKLGRTVALLRKRQALTQSELAIRASVDLDWLRAMERGLYAHPSVFTVIAVARAMHASVEQLLVRRGRS